jgi:hypothetical protein
MAGDFGLGHCEAHAAEETASTPLADMALGAAVRLGPRDAHGVEPEPAPEPLHLCGRHRGIVPLS